MELKKIEKKKNTTEWSDVAASITIIIMCTWLWIPMVWVSWRIITWLF